MSQSQILSSQMLPKSHSLLAVRHLLDSGEVPLFASQRVDEKHNYHHFEAGNGENEEEEEEEEDLSLDLSPGENWMSLTTSSHLLATQNSLSPYPVAPIASIHPLLSNHSPSLNPLQGLQSCEEQGDSHDTKSGDNDSTDAGSTMAHASPLKGCFLMIDIDNEYCTVKDIRLNPPAPPQSTGNGNNVASENPTHYRFSICRKNQTLRVPSSWEHISFTRQQRHLHKGDRLILWETNKTERAVIPSTSDVCCIWEKSYDITVETTTDAEEMNVSQLEVEETQTVVDPIIQHGNKAVLTQQSSTAGQLLLTQPLTSAPLSTQPESPRQSLSQGNEEENGDDTNGDNCVDGNDEDDDDDVTVDPRDEVAAGDKETLQITKDAKENNNHKASDPKESQSQPSLRGNLQACIALANELTETTPVKAKRTFPPENIRSPDLLGEDSVSAERNAADAESLKHADSVNPAVLGSNGDGGQVSTNMANDDKHGDRGLDDVRHSLQQSVTDVIDSGNVHNLETKSASSRRNDSNSKAKVLDSLEPSKTAFVSTMQNASQKGESSATASHQGQDTSFRLHEVKTKSCASVECNTLNNQQPTSNSDEFNETTERTQLIAQESTAIQQECSRNKDEKEISTGDVAEPSESMVKLSTSDSGEVLKGTKSEVMRKELNEQNVQVPEAVDPVHPPASVNSATTINPLPLTEPTKITKCRSANLVSGSDKKEIYETPSTCEQTPLVKMTNDHGINDGKERLEEEKSDEDEMKKEHDLKTGPIRNATDVAKTYARIYPPYETVHEGKSLNTLSPQSSTISVYDEVKEDRDDSGTNLKDFSGSLETNPLSNSPGSTPKMAKTYPIGQNTKSNDGSASNEESVRMTKRTLRSPSTESDGPTRKKRRAAQKGQESEDDPMIRQRKLGQSSKDGKSETKRLEPRKTRNSRSRLEEQIETPVGLNDKKRKGKEVEQGENNPRARRRIDGEKSQKSKALPRPSRRRNSTLSANEGMILGNASVNLLVSGDVHLTEKDLMVSIDLSTSILLSACF